MTYTPILGLVVVSPSRYWMGYTLVCTLGPPNCFRHTTEVVVEYFESLHVVVWVKVYGTSGHGHGSRTVERSPKVVIWTGLLMGTNSSSKTKNQFFCFIVTVETGRHTKSLRSTSLVSLWPLLHDRFVFPLLYTSDKRFVKFLGPLHRSWF